MFISYGGAINSKKMITVLVRLESGAEGIAADETGKNINFVGVDAICQAKTGKLPEKVKIEPGVGLGEHIWGAYVSINGRMGWAHGDVHDLQVVCRAALNALL